ncbi:MAG: hypothetical protein EAZ47_12005 [Bacteroidetes bacterium]|nr:MAG: hypothetical protein EAY72_12665 [Bacteroidota bacterium]TAF88916.1 MAG: hypothetical protein EAZ47_12005 [Bacteroidota bacterium]
MYFEKVFFELNLLIFKTQFSYVMNASPREMYQTQEKREQVLSSPIATTNPNAWLGDGYYFWYDEKDAIWWGRTAKRNTGHYEVYQATINCENVLDTVFNEEHYKFWISNIERALSKFLNNDKNNISLKYINDFFKERNVFDGIDGVMFQDITDNPEHWIVKKFQYKKRIQLAVYNSTIITNFALRFDAECD